ncbi:hypothetical protein [Sphingomonas yantingensis]|uniref:Uncharacterized protein n=1 Tax=Sphingomonas yantingensis TaxID=1241761 RepID=A0A7W9AML4_9SPHN|nr:hypothetical protein [Sphingomonas yantingensis]MBB5697133.1 hypothetical protein [Sphingomonas yantingensis]
MTATLPEAMRGAIECFLDGWRAAHGFAGLGIASFGPVRLAPGADD